MSPKHQHKFHFLSETMIVCFKTSAHITQIQLCYLKSSTEELGIDILQKYLICSLLGILSALLLLRFILLQSIV